MDLLRRARNALQTHPYGLTLFAFLLSAAVTGAGCAAFAKAFERVLAHQWSLPSMGLLAWIATPLAIVIAVEAVRRWAPEAAGTGIPQTIFLCAHASPAF